MKKINSIEELTEGQEVYVKAKYTNNNDGTFTLSLSDRYKNFFHFTPLALTTYSIELFTAEPVGNSEQLVLPEIGKEYEFSDNHINWYKHIFKGYYDNNGSYWRKLRPVQQPTEELKAIELLKSLGYDVAKK